MCGPWWWGHYPPLASGPLWEQGSGLAGEIVVNKLLQCLSAVAVVAGVGFLAVPAGAQAQFDHPIHVGVILPPEKGTPDAVLGDAVAHSAKQGVVQANEELGITAEMLGIDFSVVSATAEGADVVAAAERLVTQEGAYAIVGGFSLTESAALSAWAKAKGIPYMNVGSSADSLRNALCGTTTFHLQPSAAMYLDAMVGWYVRSNFRKWYFIQEDTPESKAQYDRVKWSMANRHFGAREAGRTVLKPGASGGAALVAAIKKSGADVVVMLVSAKDQLRTMSELDAAGISLNVTGFPYPEAQTRVFFAAAAKAAPTLGAAYRATAWEPSLDAYGAREYNARFLVRWDEPMGESAWSVFTGIKILYEAAFFSESDKPAKVMGYMTNPASIFDLYKGLGSSFRPWDRQMRQSLFLDKINPKAATLMEYGNLVGELPAIYLPGTELVERLDQLGDLAAQTKCKK